MTMRIRTDKIGGFLTMALLFMAAMNLGGKFFYYVFLAFFLVFLSKRCLKVDKTTIVYLLLCALMAVGSYGSGLLAVIRRFAPFCFYLVGVNLIANDTDSAADAPRRDVIQRKAYRLLAVVSLGSFSHYLLNYLYNRGAAVGRNTNDIWSGQAMAATGQNALACLMLGLSCAMLFFPMKEWHRWPAAAGIAVMLLYNMTLACRTMLVMLGILLLLGMLYPRQDTRIRHAAGQEHDLYRAAGRGLRHCAGPEPIRPAGPDLELGAGFPDREPILGDAWQRDPGLCQAGIYPQYAAISPGRLSYEKEVRLCPRSAAGRL